MSPERAQAYRRVLDTLETLGPSKLWHEEQDRIRHAADALIFSASLVRDDGAREALRDAGLLCRELVQSGRWEEVTARALISDLDRCGPDSEPDSEPEHELSAA